MNPIEAVRILPRLYLFTIFSRIRISFLHTERIANKPERDPFRAITVMMDCCNGEEDAHDLCMVA